MSSKAEKISVVVAGESRAISSAFYRGASANYMPRSSDLAKPTGIPDFILKGWMPDRPFIGPASNVVAFGSCFAANVGRYLASIGYDVSTQREGVAYIQRISDGLVNVHAICQQFEWAWEKRVPEVELWHGWKAEEYGYDEEVRLATKKLFDAADVFILTFGLSEIWYDEPTGEVFWRAVPQDRFDPARHKFRTATYAETVESLRRIRGLIRTYRPGAKIIFTLSPIALSATFRGVSCVTANSSSKALLRAAIDELCREVKPADPDFYYFPSYEVVCHGFRLPFQTDLRHPAPHVLTSTMKAFERYFCETGVTDEELQATIGEALERETLLLGATEAERIEIEKSDSALWRETRAKPVDIEKQVRRDHMIELARRDNLTREERRAVKHARAGTLELEERLARREARRAARAERERKREPSSST